MSLIEQDPKFLPEVWTLYGIGAAIIVTRFAVRIRIVGFRGFQGDDFMAILVLAFLTMDAGTVHIISLTESEISTFTYGSQEQLAAWYSYTALIWSMKGQMLFFFHRLTLGLWQHQVVKWLGLVCGLSYIVVILTITFGCFPTHKNWQVVPDPGRTCTLKLQNFIVTVVLNVLTDAAILAIPVPLLWKLRVEIKRKIIIFLLLCSGVFVITAAIIRVVVTLGSHPSALTINRWGVRETFIGVLCITLPILPPLFNRKFWMHTKYQVRTLYRDSTDRIDKHTPQTPSPYKLVSEFTLMDTYASMNISTTNNNTALTSMSKPKSKSKSSSELRSESKSTLKSQSQSQSQSKSGSKSNLNVNLNPSDTPSSSSITNRQTMKALPPNPQSPNPNSSPSSIQQSTSGRSSRSLEDGLGVGDIEVGLEAAHHHDYDQELIVRAALPGIREGFWVPVEGTGNLDSVGMGMGMGGFGLIRGGFWFDTWGYGSEEL